MDADSSLQARLDRTIANLENHPEAKSIRRSLAAIVSLAETDTERLDWKILSAAIDDMQRGFRVFHPYRHIRKVAVFGSARTAATAPEYQLAFDFAAYAADRGFMVLTGAGGGIMAAANAGAGKDRSFGLNIQLPYEQDANPYIIGDEKLVDFKYFFTRKLFFLRESDAVVLFPGGFGTHDEALETLTLCQTGRYGPIPLVLVDRPGGTYWQDWDAYFRKHLVSNGLIGAEDTSLYTITDNITNAFDCLQNFYRIYHSSRYVKDLLVIRLRMAICQPDLDRLNREYPDLCLDGKIEMSVALPAEAGDPTQDLPRLVLKFDRHQYARLYQFIRELNELDTTGCQLPQPAEK
jgi:uncharacterized protein (TIGR00730 family)